MSPLPWLEYRSFFHFESSLQAIRGKGRPREPVVGVGLNMCDFCLQDCHIVGGREGYY